MDEEKTVGADGTEQGAIPDITGKLSELLADPARMQSMMQMASSLLSAGTPAAQTAEKSVSDNAASGQGENPGAKETGIAEILPPTVLSAVSRLPAGNHLALLRALRPYLHPQRRARLDGMIRILEMTDMAQKAWNLQKK